MSKMIFVSLPVRDLAAATAFYEALGGELNPDYSDDETKSMKLSDQITVMLLTHDRWGTFTDRPIGDARSASYAMFALSADSRAAVNATVTSAAAAGGRADVMPAKDFDFMLNRSVEDPDGNLWEIVSFEPAAQVAADA